MDKNILYPGADVIIYPPLDLKDPLEFPNFLHESDIEEDEDRSASGDSGLGTPLDPEGGGEGEGAFAAITAHQHSSAVYQAKQILDACVTSGTGKLASPYDRPSSLIPCELTPTLQKEEVYEEGVHHVSRGLKHVETLTDLHNDGDEAEVNLISLLEEQIPRYVLRADKITDFQGYDNSDWIIQTPVLPEDEALDLSPQLIEETLKYFILCSERVGQMTKTYNDIEAVTRLLEEKEHDLELAARIGQSLLEKNKDLEAKNEQLRTENEESFEKIRQLQHDLQHKDAMLQLYQQEEDTSPSPSETVLGKGTGKLVDLFHTKVRKLESENFDLKTRISQLSVDTDALEEKEEALVRETVKELGQRNDVLEQIRHELTLKEEEAGMRQDEISNLLEKIEHQDKELKTYLIENTELTKHLHAAKQAQKELTQEMLVLEEKYDECRSVLAEAQEDNRQLRKKAKPSVIHQHYGTAPFYMPEGSLAMELEKSMHSEEDIPDGYKPKDRRTHNKRVMDTARAVRKTVSRSGSQSSLSSYMTSSEADRSAMYLSDNESYVSDGALELSMSTKESFGRMGVPGSNDLETALKRLATRKANEINERNFMADQEIKITVSPPERTPEPSGCQTPESFMSTGSGSEYSRGSSYRVPEKLQIVKPLEGSKTLHHWQLLATPSMTGLLDHRPGVQIKGERNIDTEEEIYSLSDYEEDESEYACPNKANDAAGSTYTYTTSKIMHPSDEYLMTSVYTSQKPSVTSSKSPSITQSAESVLSPRPPASGTSTFSMSFGLASILGERGVSTSSNRMLNPGRYNDLVTETVSVTTNSQTASVYVGKSGLYVPALPNINSSSMPLRYRPDHAMLTLVDRVKDIGLNSILGIVSSSSLEPVKQRNPVDVGLNTVMFMKRKGSNVKKQHQSSPSRIVHRNNSSVPISTQSVGLDLLSARVRQTSCTTLSTAAAQSAPTSAGLGQDLINGNIAGLTKHVSCVGNGPSTSHESCAQNFESSSKSKPLISPPRQSLQFATLPPHMSVGTSILSPAHTFTSCSAGVPQLSVHYPLLGGSSLNCNMGNSQTIASVTSTMTSSSGVVSVPTLGELQSAAQRPTFLEGLKSHNTTLSLGNVTSLLSGDGHLGASAALTSSKSKPKLEIAKKL